MMISKILKYILILFLLIAPIVGTPVDNDISCRPYFPKQNWLYDDFIFTSNGSIFYTYKNGFLHQWSLGNSISHEKSIKIGINFSKYKHKDNIDFMFLNNDESKMIFWTEDFFEIWDIKQEKCIGRKNVKSLFGIADTNQNVFFTFDKNNILKKWNIKNLIEEKSVKIYFGCEEWDPESGTHAPSCTLIKLVVINNDIYIITYSVIVKVSIKNMQEVKKNFIGSCGSGNISFDKKTFRCNDKFINVFSLKKIESKINNNPNTRWRRYFKYNKLYIHKVTLKNQAVFDLKNLENKNRGFFIHNNKGDWIFKYTSFYFDTSLSFKELKMKLPNGNISIMNAATYNKYYRKINFKDLIYGNK